jgi:hypothetical protein
MLQRDSDTMNETQINLGMTIEISYHALDKTSPVAPHKANQRYQ